MGISEPGFLAWSLILRTERRRVFSAQTDSLPLQQPMQIHDTLNNTKHLSSMKNFHWLSASWWLDLNLIFRPAVAALHNWPARGLPSIESQKEKLTPGLMPGPTCTWESRQQNTLGPKMLAQLCENCNWAHKFAPLCSTALQSFSSLLGFLRLAH